MKCINVMWQNAEFLTLEHVVRIVTTGILNG